MNNIRRFFKIWARGFSLSMSSQLAYRTSFILLVFSLIFSRMIGPIITILVYNISAGIPGWTLYEMILFQGVAVFVFGFSHAFVGGIAWTTQDMVNEGEFEMVLLRPFYILANIASRSVDFHGLTDVLVGLTLIIFALIKLHLFGPMLLAFALLIMLALIFIFSLNVIVASLAIIFVQVEALDNIVGSVAQFSGWPITIYPGGVKFFLTFIIPAAIASYWPASVLIGKEPLSNIILAAIPVIVFFIFAIWFWGIALKKYQSAGG
jgi:ABC-2 type transport system permease protein